MPTRTISEPAAPEGAAPCLTGEVALPADPLIGRVLGERYRLLARIGEGGMGTVYRAEHVVLRRRMAVKVLRRHLCDDEDLVRRFQGEAIAASQIGQENIVEVLDFGRTAEGAFYFVMEELEGESLAALLAASGSLPLERAALVLAQVCRALAAAHAHGIVHRDLKPDNVIVVRREDGTDFVKVVDFGISKHGGDRARPRVTRAGMIIGTPEYMAPEQGAAATVDHRADIYAFGVLAYELVTGTLPFHGETAIATLLAHQTKPVEPPARRRPGLPPAFEAIILRALEKRPDARQQSMAEVAAELTRVLVAFGLPPVYERAPAPPPSYGPLAGLTERFARGASGLSARRPRPERGTTVAIDDVASAIAVQPAPWMEPGGARRSSRVALAVALAGAGVVAAGWMAHLRGDAAGTATARTAVRAERRGAGGVEATPSPAPPPTLPSTPTPTLPSTSTSTSTANPTSNATATAPRTETPTVSGRPDPSQAGSKRTHRSPRPTSDASRQRHEATPRVPRGPLGGEAASRENPYRKLDDLKPDPF
jgi:eukaryotic-like serine/threonine-protein kinase